MNPPLLSSFSSSSLSAMTTLREPQTRHRHRHRHRLSKCHRHPTTTPITGFCTSCLRERLSIIEDSAASPTPTTTTAASPRLRRTKSYSSSSSSNPSAASASTSEPRRKSCDVGSRSGGSNSTLSNFFSLDDQLKAEKNPGAGPANVVFALREEDEIEEEEEEEGEFKTMKEFIDLELESKNCRLSFWGSAASAFSKKLLKWKLQKQHQRKSKEENESFAPEYNYKSTNSRTTRETESQMGLYGFVGRRSCDTDPRLSFDNGRYSFDEPRASWDGHLLGKTLNPRLITPMAVVEEMEKEREKVILKNEGEKSPGGSAQTRDYYRESLSVQRRRRSFDRSSSGKKGSFLDVDEVNNKSSISNAKVSPEISLFHGAKLLVTEKELRDSNWYSIKDYRAGCVESDSKNVAYVGGGVNEVGFKFKKSLRWRDAWNMWGFIQKKSEGKYVDEEKFIGEKVNVVDGLLAESWQKPMTVANGEANGTGSEKLIRSYTVSARNSFKVDGSFHGVVNGVEAKDNGMRKRDEFVQHRSRGAAYSPNNLENGLLRFYLTPVRSYRRSRSGRSRI